MIVRKTYCYEPGKTSPLPPIPTNENNKICDAETVSSVENIEKLIGNPNEFEESQEKIKRSSLTIDEKKMLPEAIEYEEAKNKTDGITLMV